MSGSFPLYFEACNGLDYNSDTTISSGKAITNPTVNNTKGAYIVLGTTTSDASYILINIFVTPNPAEVGGILGTVGLDIAIGAAASEKVILQNLVFPVMNGSGEYSGGNILVPLQIPSGTIISARYQDNDTTTVSSININIILFDSGFNNLESIAGIDSVGFSTSTSTGTAVAAGAAGAKGAYAPLTASTSRDYIGFFLGFDTQSSALLIVTPTTFLLDLAIGGSGSEKIIVPNLFLDGVQTNLPTAVGQGFIVPVHTPIFPINIPSGTRIAARISLNSTNKSTNPIGVTLYGLYQ